MLNGLKEDKELIKYYKNSNNSVYYFEKNVLTWKNKKSENQNKELINKLEDIDKSSETIDVIELNGEIITYYCNPAKEGSFIEIIKSCDFGAQNMLSYYASTIMNDEIKTINRDLQLRLQKMCYVLESAEAYEEIENVDEIYQNSFKVMRTIGTYRDYNILLNNPLTKTTVDINEELKRYCVELAPYFFANRFKKEFAIPEYGTDAKQTDNLFEYDIKNQICLVDIDLVKLTNAISHLISNAFYFTSPGNKVKFSAKITNNQLQLSVFDKGVGIKSQDMEKVKLPFYSYDPNTQKRAGMGLGLSYADLYAKKSGGNLVLTSSRGQTMATLNIPINIKEEPSNIVRQSEIPYNQENFQKNIILISNIIKIKTN